MLNKAMLVSKQDLNEFTAYLQIGIDNSATRIVAVKMRNGFSLDVTYSLPTSPDGRSVFHTPDWSYVWSCDGSSDTNKEFDMISM